MAGIKGAVSEVSGGPESIKIAIDAMIGAISVASGTVPSIAIVGSLPRFEVIFVYREA
ncbi:MAG: hypothetical protein GXX95_00885 [Methanomassiliicoccus sp.]|nr:hypothetical protein [Methanomassiliicoccus sp.]